MMIGVVGKPSSGKSTFLNAACLTDAKIGSYPFTTIEPNVGTGYVRTECMCQKLEVTCNPQKEVCLKGSRFIPVKMLDVAGLVPGAHKGKGLGNKFLSELVRADVLLHIVDMSGSLDAEGNDVKAGTHDPLSDIQWLEEEIDMWFLKILVKEDEKGWDRFLRQVEMSKMDVAEALATRFAGQKVSLAHIQKALKVQNLPNEPSKWSQEDLQGFISAIRREAKPIVVVANKIDRKGALEIFERVKANYTGKIIPASGKIEFVLRDFAEKEVIDYLPGDNTFEIQKPEAISKKETGILQLVQEKVLDQFGGTGVQEAINHAVFECLRQIIVYPVAESGQFADKQGNVLPNAFLVTKGTKLIQFVADKIHTDIADKFIYGLHAVTNRKLGEDYELKDQDVVRIVSAA